MDVIKRGLNLRCLISGSRHSISQGADLKLCTVLIVTLPGTCSDGVLDSDLSSQGDRTAAACVFPDIAVQGARN